MDTIPDFGHLESSCVPIGPVKSSMNDAGRQTNPILVKHLRILSELAGSDDAARSMWSGTQVSELSPFLPPSPAPPDDLVGFPAVSPGPRWHAEQLAALCGARDETSTDRARRRYHARMLGYALAPDAAEFRPLVTVLIPVYNRAGPMVEAVQSCIDQTWRPIEILVVDDGSTDDVGSALCRFGDQVRLIRKANGGVASARNLGVRAAHGDFIHFLDSDDLLLPTAIQNAVAAFSAVADADLCYGQGQWIDMRVTPPAVRKPHAREHPNPIRAMIVDFAFTVPTVMIPRWRMLAMPPFEEDLRRSSDWRYWQQLAFAGIKVVGHRSLSAQLRRFEHSLQATPHPEDDSHAVAVLRGLRDLLRHPHAWPYIVEYTNVLTSPRIQHWLSAASSKRIDAALSELATPLNAGSAASEEGDLSMLPVLAALSGRIARLRRRGHWPDAKPAGAYRVLETSILRAIDAAAPITDRDVAFWTAEPKAPLRYYGLRRFFTAIRHRCPPAHAAAMADALLRQSRQVPRRKRIRLATQLRWILGVHLASAVAVRRPTH